MTEYDPLGLLSRSSICRCPTCGEYFKSVSGFDKHRYGKFVPIYEPCQRRCLTHSEMQARGWRLNPIGYWQRGGSPPVRSARHSQEGTSCVG